jgi:YVTN family beta-propeller protein
VTPAAREPSFVLFESGHVRPLALSRDGERLYAANTPDGRLEVFDTGGASLELRHSVPVGLEPVAVAVRQGRSGDEVWVVNHLSDSVSIVSFDTSTPRVVRTLLVGDEPRDIVFAGQGGGRAFITTAHRGQNSPVDPALTTPGVGRADVWVFDADDLGDSLGGKPLAVLTFFGCRRDAASPGSSLLRVGTTLFNMAVYPASGALYVTGFDARNDVRFSGPGTHSTTVRGHVVDDRITVIKDGGVLPRFINKHLDYSLPQGASLPPGEKEKSLHQLLGMAMSPDGETPAPYPGCGAGGSGGALGCEAHEPCQG